LAPLLWELIDVVMDEETVAALFAIARRDAWRPLSIDDLEDVAEAQGGSRRYDALG